MDSIQNSAAQGQALNRSLGFRCDSIVPEEGEPSRTYTPHSGLITLESLRAAADAARLNEDRYRLRVSIVSAETV